MEKIFCCADITKRSFFSFIERHYDESRIFIFLFLGYTFGNINHFSLSDTLYTLMRKGDIIMFDCQARKNNKRSAMVTIFDRVI